MSLVEADRYRQQLYEIREADDLAFRDKLTEFLTLGCEYLDVENGHVKWINKERGIHKVIASVGGGDEFLPVGDTHQHATTYCRRTIERDTPLALSHASTQGWRDDPSYQAHGLQCYLGAAITVNGTTYGTVCFVNRDARATEFSPSERAFVELLAGMVGSELETRIHDRELGTRERLITVLNRVLRHNLRNGMNVIHGTAGLLVDELNGSGQAKAERIVTQSNDLIVLGEKARTLESIVSDGTVPEARDVIPLVSEVAAELRERFPSADIPVATPDQQEAVATRDLRTALYELGENAIKYSGDDPTVEFSVDRPAENAEMVVVTVEDDGPGLPEHEQQILHGRRETPLEHGSGLGLWIVYWVVTQSGGRITVDANDGTTIYIHLPDPDSVDFALDQYLHPPLQNDL